MKKVAVCISGYVRDFESTYQNLFDNMMSYNKDYQFDIFIHTWNTINSKNTQLYSRGGNDNRKFFDNFNKYDYQKLISLYNPKSICIDVTNDTSFKRYEKYQLGNNPLGVFSQFYKVSKCNELVKSTNELSDTDYDIFIRTRFDANIKPISLDNLNLNDIDLYVENDGVTLSNWISDKFGIMNKKGFDAYSNFYYNLENLIVEFKTTIPEYLLFYHLSKTQTRFSKSTEIGTIKLM